jgi:DHA1 family tetracycline resistance protein-like MFS transporter
MILLFHETHPPGKHPGINPVKGFHNIILGLQNKDLRIIYSVNFLFMLAWIASMQFLPALLMTHFKLQIGTITLSLMVTGALWSLSNLILNRQFAKLFFPGQTLLMSLIVLSLLLLSIFFSNTSTMFFLFFFPAVCCASLCWTNGLATVSLKVPSAIQGSILGINQSINSIAAMLSPILGGVLAALSSHAVYLFGGIICLAAFGILLSSRAFDQHHHP